MSDKEKKNQINNEDKKNDENEGDSDYLTLNSNSKKSKNDSIDPLQSKYSQKEKNNNTSVGVIHTSTTEKINLRKDVFGNEIKKGGQHKITFADDEIFKNENKDNKKNKDNFIEIIDVESYKLDNQLLMLLEGRYPGENICCESCFVF